MASSREIRQRIKSVKNIQHITKAMKMVAAARLRRAQERAAASKPFAEKIRQMLVNVVGGIQEAKHPLLEVRDIQNVAYFVVSADKGLAGAYNSNILKKALAEVEGRDNVRISTIGRKGREYFTRRHYTLDDTFEGFSERPEYSDAMAIAKSMAKKYTSGECDEINLVYTQFYSPLSYAPVTVKLLPVESPAGKEQDVSLASREYIFEPPAEETLKVLVPRYLETLIYAALMQAAASELGSRMAAMGSATENSSEIISQLTLHYNKIRQAGITREISEIVGGAEALK